MVLNLVAFIFLIFLFYIIINNLFESPPKIKIKINDQTTKIWYLNHEHNEQASGFDIFIPEEITSIPRNAKGFEINTHICIEAQTPMLLLARSGTGTKTPLRLSNSMGLIDIDYRGEIKLYVDNISNNEFNFNESGRFLFQLCRSDLKHFNVEFVDNINLNTQPGVSGAFSIETQS